MPLTKLWVLAYRDLGRNRRRSLLTLIAVALGLALLIVMNGFIAGITNESLENSIRLRTGHVQIRASSYNDEELSLQWRDLITSPDELVARARALPAVQAAAPVLWAGGYIATIDDSIGMQIYGIDTTSPVYDPIRSAMVEGTFLAADDRSGIIIGKALADSLNTQVGRDVSLTVVDADGRATEGIYTIRGLFATGIPSYDDSAALMPLSKAQAFTNTENRASAIIILLNNQAETEQVAAALQGPERSIVTWRDLNEVFLQAMQTGMSFYLILDAIVILIVAVIIANTLLMSVFERIREMGILSAVGMKGHQLMQMFLLEATCLGGAGVVLGIVIGLAGVGYLATAGFSISNEMAASGGSGIALGSTIHAQFVPGTFAGLSFATLAIIVLAALYPAWYAARLEPVVALRG